ncbi:MAG: hypothetical protein LBF95_05620 [Treponema sp.]|jgi:hypothetical protein|nr:hypothetical protein [Treponema sp.]
MKREELFPLALVALFALIGVSNLPAQTPKALDAFSIDDLDAVPTVSTQARYSAGIFTSDVDDYIDVNAYDPDIGTFFFLGGFPADSTSTVDVTDPITGSTSPYTVSFGLARTFSSFYLGLYFGGSFVNANGARSDIAKTTHSYGDWDAKLAALLGFEQFGGLRLDLSVDGAANTSKFDGDEVGTGGTSTTYGTTYSNARTAFALSWGKALAENLDVNAKFGIRFPTYMLNGTGNTAEKIWTGGLWGLKGGASYALNEISTLDAALTIGGAMGTRRKRDGKTATTSGNFGVIIEAALSNTFSPSAGLELGVSPNLGLALNGNGNTSKDYAGNKTNGPNITLFEFVLGLDAGIKVQLPGKLNKVSLVSGAGLALFDWYTQSSSGGDPKQKRVSSWAIERVSWNDDTLAANGNLGFGLVFDPNANLSVGFGLNAILDNLVTINLATMEVSPGTFFTNAQPGIAGGTSGLFGGLFGGTTPIEIDLTVSYKF